MLKTIYLAGVPATGKSTIMRSVRSYLMPNAVPFSFGTLRGMRQGCIWAYGVFDGSIFEGTDRLSMSVISDAVRHAEGLKAAASRNVILVEGDRLFCERFLASSNAEVIIIDAPNEVLTHRHNLRGDSQTATFLKRCRTKVENFCEKNNPIRRMNASVLDFQSITAEAIQIAISYIFTPDIR